MTALSQPACPTCHAQLSLQTDDQFDAWVCPNGHGLAFTLSEAYERLRADEVHAIWQRARAADATSAARQCPMCGEPMVSAVCEAVTLDVCVADEVLWFDAGEIEELPADVPDPAPSAAEQAEHARITTSFGDALDAGWNAEEDATITGRLTNHLLRARHSTTTP